MPCASTLPSSCSAPFLGVENIPKDFRDRQVQADQNFLVSEDRNPDRISRMSSQGLPTKHGDSTTTLTPSGEENEQDQVSRGGGDGKGGGLRAGRLTPVMRLWERNIREQMCY